MRVKKSSIIGKCELILKMTRIDDGLQESPMSNEKARIDQYQQAVKLLEKFNDISSIRDGDLGRASFVKHRIDTSSPTPIRQLQRRILFAKLGRRTRRGGRSPQHSYGPVIFKVIIPKRQ